jgi:polysaccharide export outer membrane protein
MSHALMALLIATHLMQAPAVTAMDASSAIAATADAGTTRTGRSELARYRLRPGDSIELDFRLTPEFNQTLLIQPDGYITLRGIGPLLAAGLTLPGLVERCTTLYGRILRAPEITIDLKSFQMPYFVVGGEVGQPGKFELRSDVTVTQAIAMAGGFKESAKHSRVWLFRRVDGNYMETMQLDLKKQIARGDMREDVHLQADDMVYVPKSALAKFEKYIPVPGFGFFLGQRD